MGLYLRGVDLQSLTLPLPPGDYIELLSPDLAGRGLYVFTRSQVWIVTMYLWGRLMIGRRVK